MFSVAKMAGDTGSPQQRPTDLSMKTHRKKMIDSATDYIGAYHANQLRSPTLWNEQVGTFNVTKATSNHNVYHARTPQEHSNAKAIKDAIDAITHSLPLTPTCIRSVQGGRVVYNERWQAGSSSDEDTLSRNISSVNQEKKTNNYRWSSSTTSSPELEIIEDEKSPMITELRDNQTDKMGLPPVLYRMPTYVETILPETPEEPEVKKPGTKTRKRKLGPGRGWKFHDLSVDGGTTLKKRAYSNNKLEKKILRIFHERVCVKTVPALRGRKPTLIIVEPAEITDPDLIKCGTALRLLIDKETNLYKLQLLPYTLEEGPLSDHDRVLQAVVKMLSENSEVLCPTAFATLAHAGSSAIISDHRAEQPIPTAHFSETLNTREVVETNSMNSMHEAESPIRDQLLWLMNNHVMKSNGTALGRASGSNSSTRCLMWHTPFLFHSDNQETQTISKWCTNCRNAGACTSTYPSEMIS